MAKKAQSQEMRLRAWIRQTWKNLNIRTVNGRFSKHCHLSPNYFKKGIRLEMSKDEFVAWARSNETLILSMWNKGDTPSIDRLDRFGHYKLDNIRIVTLKANMAEGRRANVSSGKAVVAKDLDSGKTIVFQSLTQAAKWFGCSISAVWQALRRKKRWRHRGYEIKYAGKRRASKYAACA